MTSRKSKTKDSSLLKLPVVPVTYLSNECGMRKEEGGYISVFMLHVTEWVLSNKVGELAL